MMFRSILAVDDCDLSQMIMQLEIEKFDPAIEVIPAFDGQEALDRLAGLPSPPDLILLDINMPRMNGHEFLKAYSRATDRPRPTAMLSSSQLEDDRLRAAAYPYVTHFLAKPFSKDYLARFAG